MGAKNKWGRLIQPAPDVVAIRFSDTILGRIICREGSEHDNLNTTATTDPTTLEQQDTTTHTCDNTTIITTAHSCRLPLPPTTAPKGRAKNQVKTHMPTQQMETAQFTNLNLSASPLANARTTTTECPKTSCNDASGQKSPGCFGGSASQEAVFFTTGATIRPKRWIVNRLTLP